MTENELREKVIKAFEFCLMPPSEKEIEDRICSHEDCPYYREYNGGKCISAEASDALALLKAQEPRVMTLEEVQALHANDVVWLEDKGKPNIIPGIVRNRHLWPHSATMVTNFMRGDGCKVTADDDDYGKRWRSWTSRPTDEQMEKVNWE